MFHFPRSRRLLNRGDYDAVFSDALRSRDESFTVLARKNFLLHPRLGMAISSKTTKNIIKRNQIKRLVRETFRLEQERLPAVDMVVIAQPGALRHNRPALRHSLLTHWESIARQCGSCCDC